jgi:hypothetical protein
MSAVRTIPWERWNRMTDADKSAELSKLAEETRGSGKVMVRSESLWNYLLRRFGMRRMA